MVQTFPRLTCAIVLAKIWCPLFRMAPLSTLAALSVLRGLYHHPECSGSLFGCQFLDALMFVC